MSQTLGRVYENLKQYRPAVKKGVGVTKSERVLARLAEQSFLNLWSYPCPYRDQKLSDSGDGKELCDLLVVCGRYILIFSEKTIAWPNASVDVAWRRWFKRAILKAARQAKGAERWIKNHPDRVFLDRRCENPFPIDFPAPDERIIHRVVVAKGARGACKQQFRRGSGSLIIRPAIRGSQHWSGAAGAVEPFCIGDIDSSGSFVHVIDEVGLGVLMKELDTVTDFAEYLERKANFVRSGQLAQAAGEENLLAYYAVRVNNNGEHDFVLDSDPAAQPVAGIGIGASLYPRLVRDPRYIAKKKADEISYVWDSLIETFTTHILGGTSVTPDGYEFDLKKSELGVRYMALERRFFRRSHGEAVHGAMETGTTKDMFFRLMMGTEDSTENETAFFMMTFKYPDILLKDGGYDKYRIARTNMAHIYARGVLERFGHLKRVVGVSMEPPSEKGEQSEDMIYMEQVDWTEEQRRSIRADCERCGVFRNDLRGRRWQGQEYPDVESITVARPRLPTGSSGMNRRQRRAAAAIARRSRKHRTGKG